MSQVRAYGGWRERRGFGIGALTGTQTAAALIVVIGALAAALVYPAALPIVGLPLLLSVALVTVRVRGETVSAVVVRHVGWVGSKRRGATSYRGRDSPDLPGVLADLRILEAVAGDVTIAVAWDRARDTITAIVPVEPLGLAFTDDPEVAEWVRGWGDWLAHLGYVPDLAHVVVTVQSGPAVAQPLACAPAASLADEAMAELRNSSAPDRVSRTLVSLTLAVGREGVDAACVRLVELLSTMQTLARSGVSVLPACSVAQTTGWIRACFDPDSDPGTAHELAEARPTAVEEYWDSYRHDGGTSVGFLWDECPGEQVGPEVLGRLLEPADYHKRVSLVYEPMPAHDAAREVDRQAQAAVFRSQYRRRLGRDETARDRIDLERAQETARDQASGSGVADVGLYVVATVTDPRDLEACIVDVRNRAGESRIRLRRSYGGQAEVFAVTLGLGYVPKRRW